MTDDPRDQTTDQTAGQTTEQTAEQTADQTAEQTQAEHEGPAETTPTVVGIGASAGGLEAFRQVLGAIPEDTGLSIVLIQHLAPEHESRLPELLASEASIPVEQAEDGQPLEPDHVYVIPPNTLMTVEDSRLRLSDRPAAARRNMPIDHFFRSLADAQGSRAAGVVLSGTASDGTEGLRRIQGAGGVTIAQDPETAQHDGMPRSAIRAGAADMVLAPEAIGHELARIGRHPYLHAARPRQHAEPASEVHQLHRIFELLRRSTGVDFSSYKPGTFNRRLQRRMMLHRLDSLDHYLEYLHRNPDELRRLYEDVLIHVTQFFREPEAFEALKEKVFPKLIEQRADEQPIRIWIPGCSTGEEAYSVAITLLEALGNKAGETPIQIFATDIAEGSIETARNAVYRENITADVSEERLRRFFTRVEGGYRVAQPVRELCIFSRQDLTRDPPFSRIDLLLCRNVLIYMDRSLQERLLRLFHYALKPTGFLLLGESETADQRADIYEPFDKKHRIYTPKRVEAHAHQLFPAARPQADHQAPEPRREPSETRGPSVQREADHYLLRRFGPPAVVVDANRQVLYIRGSTGTYLEPPQGEPSHDLLKMAREGLLHALRAALHEAHKEGKAIRKEGIHVRSNGHFHEVNVEVVPLGSADGGDRFLVLFEEPGGAVAEETPREAPARAEPATEDAKDRRIHELEQELDASRGYLQSVIQDLEASNEELQTANEEILSSNEELQSTNEELDTAREELQSTNEELNTLNDELHGRNEELARANSDLMNLLGSVQIGVVIVDEGLKVRRFTPMAEQVMNLRDTDIDRPLGHINPNINFPNLEAFVRRSVEEVTPLEREVRDHAGRWYSLRVRPYKNVANRIEGAVLSLFDISELKQRQRELDHLRRYAEAIVETIHDPLLVLDGELCVQTANRAFCRMFRVSPEQTTGTYLYELGNKQWDIPPLREALGRVLSEDGQIEGYHVTHEFPAIGHRTMRLNARRLADDDERAEMILLAFEEVTEPRDA